MTIAVDDQYLDFSISLTVLTRKVLLIERVGVAGVERPGTRPLQV